MFLLLGFFVLGVLGGTIVACTTPAPNKSAVPRSEEKDFALISSAYSHGLFSNVIQKGSLFEKNYPTGKHLGQVENLHGLALIQTKSPAQAVIHFKNALKMPKEAEAGFRPYVLYNLATAQMEANQTQEALLTLSEVQLDSIDRDTRFKFETLKGHLYFKRREFILAIRQSLLAWQWAPEANPGKPEAVPEAANIDSAKIKAKYPTMVSILEQSLRGVDQVEPIEQIYNEFSSSPMSDIVLLRLISLSITQKNTAKQGVFADTLGKQFPQSPKLLAAKQLIHDAQEVHPTEVMKMDLGTVDPKAVGVLLPLQGKFAAYGARSLQGIELAFGLFSESHEKSEHPEATGVTGVTLHIEDSGDTPEQAISALNKLVQEKHVIAVIGPLLSKGIDQVSQRAQELGVPMISLARHIAGPEEGTVIQGGLTLKSQAEAIARYAVQKLDLHRFAILTPQDKIGEESRRYFWDAVEALGGEVTGVETYSSSETDFRHIVDKLSGLYYTEARQRELDNLAKERAENHIKKRTRKTEQYFSLKPIVDYDAVFIPDDAKASAQLLPTFAYRDVDHVKFLGISTWNSQEFITRAQAYAENALFVDAFFPEGDSPVVRRYREKFQATFDEEASVMDAISYDAARVLDATIAYGAISRVGLLEMLKGTKKFQSVTGQISFEAGNLARNLKVLTIHGGKVAQAAQ